MNLRDAELEQSLDRPGFRLRGTSIREALGGELIGGTLYEFDPGEQLWPYHFHRGNEEWLVVVAGTPSLRTPDGERELRPGDVVGFPEGEAGAHTLYNRSDGPVRLAIFSTLAQGLGGLPGQRQGRRRRPGLPHRRRGRLLGRRAR